MGVTANDQTRPATIGQRLGSCRDRIDELEEQLKQERRRRDELIVSARDDDGASYQQIARWAGVVKSRVIAVLAAN